ncbi:SE1561 family protein [Thalassobacillus hwangdonensis]|uniref:SE1561 family protein n=1 Tax=Thalassobacillus hwangdonensis TaxID=546108 RepID=A0ABW3L478_9BACI
MGKAVDNPAQQFHYIKNRIKMLNQVVETMDEEISEDDFDRLLDMIGQLHQKMERFKKDWNGS